MNVDECLSKDEQIPEPASIKRRRFKLNLFLQLVSGKKKCRLTPIK